ncbi:lysophospholipid acyltransferase family protein [Plantactinospora sp. CA-290183]|uniref:lysophospholipid acyltransferase family protein n=1 Tax=Plantactinospora sp. CA-290183 TaxID=3240006 RepID=UPI003D91AC9C
MTAPAATARPEHSLWRPHSGCGPDCLPAPGRTPVVPGPRRLARLGALLGALLFGAALLPVLPVLSRPARHRAGRAWARTVLRAAGIRLTVRGRLPDRRALLVANHVSWLDVVAILAAVPARMLAKQEVRRWPLIGTLAALGGAIFVDRARPRTLPATVARVAAQLRADGVVAVFPEGTTWCGSPAEVARCASAVRFRPAMFQAAVDARAPVVPVHLEYRIQPGPGAAPGAGTTVAAFLAEESLLTSVRRVLAVRDLVVTLTVTPDPGPGAAGDRRALAAAAEAAVRAAARAAGHAAAPVPSDALGLAA